MIQEAISEVPERNKFGREQILATWPTLRDFVDVQFPRPTQLDSGFNILLENIYLISDPEAVPVPDRLWHITSSLPITLNKDPGTVLVPGLFFDTKRAPIPSHFNLRTAVTETSMPARQVWTRCAVWGGKELDEGMFEEMDGQIFNPERARFFKETVEAVVDNWCEMAEKHDDRKTLERLEQETKALLKKIGIRALWGEILSRRDKKGLLENIAGSFNVTLIQIEDMEQVYNNLPEEAKRLIEQAFPIAVKYQAPVLPLLIDTSATSEIMRSPNRILPAFRGVNRNQIAAIVVRERDKEQLVRGLKDWQEKPIIRTLEELRRDESEELISSCEVRYQKPFTKEALDTGVEQGLFTPLVRGIGKRRGIYEWEELHQLNLDLDREWAEEFDKGRIKK